ncbi:galactitol-1-phosphate 5-dehydrogenase [Sunxiuqinia dokdonensis]|uniref:Zn-dependent alcohol dehydrogenase n=1 Tax=Sunxiuqinia dokdonensis TaxID=1409788 RepID=A0A0L8VDH4_9BACT|nr:galactitol-1-phosphate 5-dehydrogenase [Sunxiuqinia dokdonensis]KOH46506.1 Zn-dependent alcohol dehydrogenase [Sunxiuqinia dokdonensis]
MKALVLEKYNQFEFKEVEKPEVEPNEVLVKVKSVGICGSDVHGMDGSTGRRQPPLIMGHEASGEITAVGSSVQNWQVGDRVTFDSTIYQLDDWYTRQGLYNLSDNRVVLGVSCDDYRRHGAFAEFVAVPQHILYRIPENVTFTQAAMVEPVAVALHALSLGKPEVNDAVVVVGAGMIGLFVIQLLKVAGCGKIMAIDLDEDKLTLAARLGATHCFNSQLPGLDQQILELTNGRGADQAYEAVGVSETVQLAVASVRKGGTVTLLGNLSPNIDFPLQSVVTRQIKVQGSCAICGEYPAVLDLIADGKVDVNALVSAEAPLAEGADWFNRLYNKEKGLVKVILKP